MNMTVQNVKGVDTGLTKLLAGCTAEYRLLQPRTDAPWLSNILATIRFEMSGETQVLFSWGSHSQLPASERTHVMLSMSSQGTFIITSLVVNNNMVNVRPVN